MKKKTRIQSYTSEYCMSAGDNSVSRQQIDKSITTPDAANEHSYRQAMLRELNNQ